MITRSGRVFVRYLLFPLLIIFTLAGLALGQAMPPLTPPAWSVGQWWVVECQVYDTGKLVKGAQPKWLPPVAWRFQVEKQAELAGQPYYVVAVTPAKGNNCSYSFRYWFRVSDRFVGRMELIHPQPTPTKPRVIGPPVVTQDFLDQAAAPFLTDEFPDLPVAMPLFSVGQKTAAFADTPQGNLSQTMAEVSPAVMDKANKNLVAKMGPSLSTQNLAVKVASPDSKVSELQYWNASLPFPFYGETSTPTYTSRKYWLVDTGKN